MPGKIFTYEEALKTLPEVQKITHSAVAEIEALVNGLRRQGEIEDRREEVEAACQQIVEAWSEQIQALGCEPKFPWLVDWDNGGGYYCWQYPEITIGYFHTYEDGFRGRVPVN